MADPARDFGDLWESAASIPETPARSRTFPKDRAAAIDRAKDLVLDHLCARAKGRVGLPIASAGVTADDVWDLLNAHASAWLALIGTDGRSLSWVGPWLAGVARSGRLAPFFVEGVPVSRRATRRDASHGNAHRVYLHPDDPRVVGGARSQRPDP